MPKSRSYLTSEQPPQARIAGLRRAKYFFVVHKAVQVLVLHLTTIDLYQRWITLTTNTAFLCVSESLWWNHSFAVHKMMRLRLVTLYATMDAYGTEGFLATID